METKKELTITEKIQSKSKGDSTNNKFWKSPVSIPGFGVCKGRVTSQQLEAFLTIAPTNIDLSKWIIDFDPIKRRDQAAKAKMKRRAN